MSACNPSHRLKRSGPLELLGQAIGCLASPSISKRKIMNWETTTNSSTTKECLYIRCVLTLAFQLKAMFDFSSNSKVILVSQINHALLINTSCNMFCKYICQHQLLYSNTFIRHWDNHFWSHNLVKLLLYNTYSWQKCSPNFGKNFPADLIYKWVISAWVTWADMELRTTSQGFPFCPRAR